MEWKKRVIGPAAAGVVLTGGVLGMTGMASAQSVETTAPSVATSTAHGVELPMIDIDYGLDDEGGGFDFELTAEEITEWNAETDALVKHLKSLGFTVPVATDDLGIRYLDLDEQTADEVFVAIDDYCEALFLTEVAGWTADEKAEWNAEVDAIVAEFAADGVTVQTEEIAPGVRDLVWTDELDAFIDEMFDDEDLGAVEDLDGDSMDADDWDLTADEIAELNAETDALVQHLKAQGFDVPVATDDLGLRYLDIDENRADLDALLDVVDDYYEDQFIAETATWSDAEKADWNAMTDEFVAEFAKAGVTVQTEEIAPGVRVIVIPADGLPDLDFDLDSLLFED